MVQERVKPKTDDIRYSLSDIPLKSVYTSEDLKSWDPLILECVKAYATLGEIANVMRQVWGSYREPAIL